MVAIVLLLFASGISIIVAIHETGWLLTSKQPIIDSGSRCDSSRCFQQSDQTDWPGVSQL